MDRNSAACSKTSGIDGNEVRPPPCWDHLLRCSRRSGQAGLARITSGAAGAWCCQMAASAKSTALCASRQRCAGTIQTPSIRCRPRSSILVICAFTGCPPPSRSVAASAASGRDLLRLKRLRPGSTDAHRREQAAGREADRPRIFSHGMAMIEAPSEVFGRSRNWLRVKARTCLPSRSINTAGKSYADLSRTLTPRTYVLRPRSRRGIGTVKFPSEGTTYEALSPTRTRYSPGNDASIFTRSTDGALYGAVGLTQPTAPHKSANARIAIRFSDIPAHLQPRQFSTFVGHFSKPWPIMCVSSWSNVHPTGPQPILLHC